MIFKKYSIYLLPSSIFVIFIMFLVGDTNADRSAYVWHFSNPFGSSRIEIGFQYYTRFFHIIGIPPEFSPIITSLIIYILLFKIWTKYVNLHWVESILIVNIIIFGVFNYYLGTSIRMGLALAIILYSYYKIEQEEKYIYYVLLLIAPFIHYAASLFLAVVLLKRLLKLTNWTVNKYIILIITILLLFFYQYILSSLQVGSYYSMYLNGQIESGRIFSFGMSLYIVLLFDLYRVRNKNSTTQMVLFSVPILILSIFSGMLFLQKTLTPFLFIALIEWTNKYYKRFYCFNGNIRFIILVVLNILSVIYALMMYHYI